MPQLSIETFVTQYFWLLVVFFTLFILSSLYIMPKISEIKKTRKLLENVEKEDLVINSQKSVSLLNSHKCS